MFATTFTSIHTILSLVALASGIGVIWMLVNDQKPNVGTLVFLITAIATSVTGFLFPFTNFLPSHGVGAICLVLFVPALLAQYKYDFAGAWRWVYVISMAVNVSSCSSCWWRNFSTRYRRSTRSLRRKASRR